MIDNDNLRRVVVKGLKDYLQCPVVRSNQNGAMPDFPYVSYTVITLADESKATYGKFEDGILRKPHIQTWSITIHSDDYAQAVELANKAKSYLDCVGTLYLNDNGVIVQSVGNITDRTSLITVDYMYNFGFDCFFWLYDEIQAESTEQGQIDSATINGTDFAKQDLEKLLKDRLDGVI